MNLRALSQRMARAALRALSPGGASPLYVRVKARASDFIRFPCHPPRISQLERAMIALRRGPMTCMVCGAFTRFTIDGENLRESCVCRTCDATNRKRQLAYVLCDRLSETCGRPVAALASLAHTWPGIDIYNTESRGSLHERLSTLKGYQCSEYFGPGHKSGDKVEGVLHQDLMQLSFGDASFDLVISSDVFEHIPDPYRAHAEVARVLRKGGRHVFTVPFDWRGHLDHTRARRDSKGAPELLAPALYHHDPVSGKNDVLVYTIFGLEMLVRLRHLGFETTMYHLSAPWLGILGPDAIVFDALKV